MTPLKDLKDFDFSIYRIYDPVERKWLAKDGVRWTVNLAETITFTVYASAARVRNALENAREVYITEVNRAAWLFR
jgi:hypothetical protein